MAAHVEDSIREAVRSPRDLECDSCPPKGQSRRPSGEDLPVLLMKRKSIKPRIDWIRFKNGADGVMGAGRVSRDNGGLDELFINDASVGVFRNVALGLGQPIDKAGFQIFIPYFTSQLHSPGRILDDL